MRLAIGVGFGLGIGGLWGVLAPSIARAERSTTSIEQAYDLAEVPHPRAIAVAGAQQAFGGSTTALFANPANLALYRVYHLEGIGAISPEARGRSFGGSIADSSTSAFAGGFSGTWSQFDSDGIKRQWTDLRLSLAYPFGDRLSVGVTGRYLRTTQNVRSGPLGASLVSDGTVDQPLVNLFTFDAGAAVQLTEHIRAGLSGRNLTAPGTALTPVAVAGGIGWSSRSFTLEADSLVDFTTYQSARPRVMVGAEAFAAEQFPIRAGYRYDDGTRSHAVSAGLGYVDKSFSVDVGARRDVVAAHPATVVSVGVRIFIDSGLGGSGNQNSF